MSCMLRVSGTHLDVDALLKSTGLRSSKVWHKNELRNKRGSRLHDTSGFSVVVSNAEYDEFEKQMLEASEFIRQNADALDAIKHFQGVEYFAPDFGVELSSVAPQSLRLKNQLLQLAAARGLDLELSHYPK